METVDSENDVDIGITAISSKAILARGKPHTKVLQALEEVKESTPGESESSDYEDSNASDVEEEFELNENEYVQDLTLHNWQKQFPMLEEWKPEADKLAKKRKTMASR